MKNKQTFSIFLRIIFYIFIIFDFIFLCIFKEILWKNILIIFSEFHYVIYLKITDIKIILKI